MKADGIDSNDLTPYEGDRQLIAEIAAQVIKDFESCQLSIVFSGDPERAYDELHTQIAATIAGLSRTEPALCTALLYRIDIPEKQTARALSEPDFPEHLARLILQREMQKVILRKHFK